MAAVLDLGGQHDDVLPARLRGLPRDSGHAHRTAQETLLELPLLKLCKATSQLHVSRLLARALTHLRERLIGPAPDTG